MSQMTRMASSFLHKAEESSLKLHELQGEYLLHLEEVIVAIKDHNGKVKLRQAGSLFSSDDDVVFAGFCGALTSLIFLNTRRVLRQCACRCGNHRSIHEGIGRKANSWWIGSFRTTQKAVTGHGESAERAEGNWQRNLDNLGYARGRGQIAGCFERGEIVSLARVASRTLPPDAQEINSLRIFVPPQMNHGGGTAKPLKLMTRTKRRRMNWSSL
jgi:hypothetical protein